MKFHLYILLLLAAGCGSSEEPSGAGSAVSTSGLEDFDNFYLRFHRDTAYQREHITFPLEGLPPGADSLEIATESFRWDEESWVPHRLFNETDFRREFKVINEMMVVENIYHQAGDMGMIRRFAKMGDEWYLIYYAGLNRISKPK